MDQQNSRSIELLVIGSGPGGYVAAIRAAQLGKNVIVVEKENIGGVCLNRGCIPSKALVSAAHKYNDFKHVQELGINIEQLSIDFEKTQAWKQNVINSLADGVRKLFKKYNIELVHGEATFINNTEVRVFSKDTSMHISFDSCIIAAGSRPIEIPTLPFSKTVLSSTEALSLNTIPKSMIVVGGGYVGIELSQVYAKFGTSITILEGASSILPGFDARLVSFVKRNLKKANVEVYTNATASSVNVHDNLTTVNFTAKDKEQTIAAEYVLVTVGRRPNTDSLGLDNTSVKVNDKGFIVVDKQGRSSVNNIFAIGDVVSGLALAHKASYEAKIAAEAVAGMASEVNYRTIPSIVFSDPELASVGMTEKEAKEQGLDTVIGRFSYGANGRALAMNEPEGSITIVADKSTKIILGAQIVGVEASNLIAELAVAVENQMHLEDIAETIHAHPTLSEMIMEAAEVALEKGVHTI
ncbi:dihydrolipoyl dehydrogenase [Desulfuribacillus alkaliarsenatis]|uniref:Dihydrolipoyl dehydrogenase n=1 Tax=Desulfuribacillus alkaliarsenatis TaxID=766136 RepID=A0A1E5G5X1_9FIRM|nr:dihydrolipoyl dehydrogenase [Desulfuribacillus alkaliarsenatis]OEF98588.1 dihydrolipoyl dehydrogenase [Desulfuribacillus alkaliarsenatis]